MFAWSTQFEVGPLSETSIGNQGGYYYSIGCGTKKTCLTTPPYSAGANNYTGVGGLTNNTGWTDFIITPVVGFGWIAGGRYHRPLYRDANCARTSHTWRSHSSQRTWSQPARWRHSLLAKFPWMLPAPRKQFRLSRQAEAKSKPLETLSSIGSWARNTPTSACRCSPRVVPPPAAKVSPDVGTTFTYNFTRGFAFDSALNLLPGQNGSQGMMQGLFGVRLGQQFNASRIFGKVRPGFIYYKKHLPAAETESDEPHPLCLGLRRYRRGLS